MGVAGLLNTAWMLSCAREAMAFRHATRRVADTQANVLATILQRNRDTEFGRAHRFDAISNPRTYQQRVPLSGYEDYAESIQRIGEGKSGVLTHDPVELLEPTSGTTRGEKLIPFTATLRGQYQRAVAAWMFDLFRHRPTLRRGRAYWSISPAMGNARRTPGGIPIGFDDDADYLGSLERLLLKRLLAVPSEITRVPNIESFRYCTLWFLLQAADLTLISVWSPTFLTALLSQLEEWHDRLCDDVRVGRPNPPVPLPPDLARQLSGTYRGNEFRAAAMRNIFRSPLPLPEKLRQLWPRLSLISCWADAGAAHYMGEMQRLFPNVEVQPKGLLATEGCISFPLLGRAAPVLAIRSHFYEFQELDSPRRLHLARELDRGGRYRVVLTTGGGLYRYELRDEIEVCGFENQCPLLRFIGKSDCVSDLVGEKLAEPHVRAVLGHVFERHRLTPIFSLVVPVEGRPPRYRLYIQAPSLSAASPILTDLVNDLEVGLRENPHYAYARQLEQLGSAEVRVIDPFGESGWTVYERQNVARGMRAGNIKPMMLDLWLGWPEVFDPLCTPHQVPQNSAQ